MKVELDLVLFEDGSFWGPNKSRQLERFQGQRDGPRLEREAAAGEGSIPAGSGLLGQGNRRPLVHPQGPDA